MRRRGVLDLDWRRISRWCCLGTAVMLVWLLAPVASCSFRAFRDIPLGDEAAPSGAPSSADRQRVKQAHGFMSTWASSIEECYERTPLLGQEEWKSWALLGVGSAMMISWALAKLEARRRRTFT